MLKLAMKPCVTWMFLKYPYNYTGFTFKNEVNTVGMNILQGVISVKMFVNQWEKHRSRPTQCKKVNPWK